MTEKPKMFQEVADDIYYAEVEAGRITPGDIAILRNQEKYASWPKIGLVLGAAGPAVYGRLYRRPPLPFARTLLLASLGSFTLTSVGTFIKIRSFVAGLNQMEDKDRFAGAVKGMAEEMLKRRGMNISLETRGQNDAGKVSREVIDGESTTLADGWDGGGNGTGQENNSDMRNVNGTASSSRWDQIRAAQQTAKPTSWDIIRQTHEKEQMARSNTTSTTPNQAKPDSPSSFSRYSRDEDRETEQAKFDALLESERHMSSQGYADPSTLDPEAGDKSSSQPSGLRTGRR
jgi:hypothetical protein